MKKSRRILNKFFIIVFSLACVAVCVCLAQVFASVLTVGGLSFTNINSDFADFKVYAISLGTYSTKSAAEASAASAHQKNAGGFVYRKDGLFYVLASAYEKENDAKLVQESLSGEGINNEIITITFNEVELQDISTVLVEKEFIESLNIFKTAFLKLYDISVSLDTSVIDITRAKIEIIAVKAEVEGKLESLTKGASTIDGIYYQIIKNKYNIVIQELNDLKNYEEIGGIFLSAKIKYSYLYIINVAEDLIASLNNEK